MKQLLTHIPKFLLNKYLLITIAFVVWLSFFDRNNLINQSATKTELNRLNEQRKFYKEEIKNINATKTSLFTNPDHLERFARERYLMKKQNEDLFIIETDTLREN